MNEPTEPPGAEQHSTRKLVLDDIADVRAYERRREVFQAQVIDTKARRRVALGTVITVLFENRDTMLFQIQEMARVEQLSTDGAIQDELDTYNPMIPEPGQLRVTMFIELTTDEQLREWLPRLVDVQHHLVLVLPNGDTVRAMSNERHEAQLTREHITSAVHYLGFEFTEAQVAAFTGHVRLRIDHASYDEETTLLPSTIEELRRDLLP